MGQSRAPGRVMWTKCLSRDTVELMEAALRNSNEIVSKHRKLRLQVPGKISSASRLTVWALVFRFFLSTKRIFLFFLSDIWSGALTFFCRTFIKNVRLSNRSDEFRQHCFMPDYNLCAGDLALPWVLTYFSKVFTLAITCTFETEDLFTFFFKLLHANKTKIKLNLYSHKYTLHM